MGSKIVKIGLYFLLFIFLFLGGCILAIRTPYVQNLIIDQITEGLSEKLGTEVSVERVGVSFPDYAVLDGVRIMDYNDKSVLYIKSLKLALESFDSDEQKINFSKVTLIEPNIFFNRPEGSERFNYNEIISKLQAGPSTSSSTPWVLDLGHVTIQNGTFVFHDETREASSDSKFKDNHLLLRNIQLDADNFEIVDDSLHFNLAQLHAEDHSGLTIDHMKAVVNIHSKGIEFGQFELKTPHSVLKDTFSMTTQNYKSYAHFFDSVKLYSIFDHTTISGEDLAIFSNDLTQYAGQDFELNGLCKGYLKKLKLRGLQIDYGQNSQIIASGKIWGLPAWSDTYLDLDFDKLETSGRDIDRLGVTAPLPDFMHKAGIMRYKGRFQGFENDFVAYGSVLSNVGSIKTDLNFKINKGQSATYSGSLAGTQVDVGRLFDIPDVGKTSFAFKLQEGTGLNLNEFRTKFEGKISSFDYDGYTYSNTTVNGNFDQKKFEGVVLVNDPNLTLDFKGEIDYNTSTPMYNVRAIIDDANLEALGIDTSIQKISGVATAQFSGSGIVDFNGKLDIEKVNIVREGVEIPLNKLNIKSETKDSIQSMVLNSDFVDIKLEGQYDLKEWNSAYKVFIHDLFPDFYPLPEERPKASTYTMNMRFKNSPFLGAITGNQYRFGTGTLKGSYSSVEQSLRVDGELSHMAYEKYRLDDWSFNIIKEPHQLLNLSMDIAKLKDDGKELTHDIIFDAHILPNDAEFLFNFAYPDDEIALNSYGELKFRADTIEAYFMESVLYVQGVKWLISNDNRVVYQQDEIDITGLSFSNGTSGLKIDGKINDKPEEELVLELKDFDLNNLSPFVPGTTFGGKAFGTLDLHRLSTDPFFISDLVVDDLLYNDNYLGNLELISQADHDPLLLNVSAELKSGMIKDLDIVGSIDLHSNKRTMDLAIKMSDVDATPLEEIFTGLASNFDGKVSADLKAKGKFSDPKISGEVSFDNMGLTVDYLQTRYVTNGSMDLSESQMTMNNIKLEDEQGDGGTLKGKIKHQLFDEFEFDLKFEDLTNFLVLNTSKDDNELFYGRAFVDGRMDVKGPLDDIYLNIFAKTRKGTEIFIPLVYEAGTSNVSYINFVDFKDTSQKQKMQKNLEGLTMNLTLDITPEAKTELIFDEFVNDKITGRGEGRLKMEITSSGEFDMYGDYVIEEGDYPVSAFNTTPTRFILKKGGKIRWNGDPYEATIDLEANIIEKVNPNTLLASSAEELNQSSTNIEVECQLFLKGSLFSPVISFGLNVPNTGGSQTPSRFNAVLNSIKDDPDELNRQVFAIIVFGSFIPPTFAEASVSGSTRNDLQNTFRNSVSGMISNQLSQWVNQWDHGLDLSVDWDQGSIYEREQVIVEVKKQFAKDRLELKGLYDVSQNAGTAPWELEGIWKVSEKIWLKGFHKLANDPTLGNANTVSTTGVGFFYQKRFNTLKELFEGDSKKKSNDHSPDIDDK